MDRRVQRSRKLLRDALLSLIRERGFSALSVQDIIDRADVGRATFYAHFENKQDLLLTGLEGVEASLKALQRQALARGRPVPEERLFAFSRELFAHTGEHREVFRAMVDDRSVALLEQVFRKMLVDLVRADVKALLPPGPRSRTNADALVQFVAGGLFGLLMWWLDGKNKPSVDEVNTAFRRLAVGAVRAETGPPGDSQPPRFRSPSESSSS